MDEKSKAMILTAPPGVGFFLAVSDAPGGQEYCAFCVREKRKYLEDIPRNPLVALRGGFWRGTSADIVYVLWKFSGNNKSLYETYFNICNVDSRKCFDLLAVQAQLAFVVFDSAANPARKIVTAGNNLRRFCAQLVEQNAGRTWSMSEFDRDKEEFYGKYTAYQLWEVSEWKFDDN